jgi:hypothetical protein
MFPELEATLFTRGALMYDRCLYYSRVAPQQSLFSQYVNMAFAPEAIRFIGGRNLASVCI